MTHFHKLRRYAVVILSLLAGGSAFAQSQVTLYGIVATDAVRATHVVTRLVSANRSYLDNSAQYASRLGFSGKEDLGGGLAATFGLEAGVSPDTGTANGGSTFFDRGSTVGLKGRFGAVTIGRQWNVNDDVMGNYFVYGGYAAFRYTEFDWLSDLVNNSVKYISPVFGNFQFEALGGLGEGQPRTAEVAGTYAAGPFSASATYHLAQNRVTGKDDKLTSAGASYQFGIVKVRAAYARSQFQASGFLTASTYDVGADVDLAGPSLVSLDYVARDQKGTGNDSHFLRLRGIYFLSKRTTLNANVVVLKNKGAATEHFYGDGAAGLGQNVFTAGLSHAF